MAFYKRKSMDRKCVYDSMRYSSSYFNEECEHVIYHYCLRFKGAKIFMNPNMVIYYDELEPSKK